MSPHTTRPFWSPSRKSPQLFANVAQNGVSTGQGRGDLRCTFKVPSRYLRVTCEVLSMGLGWTRKKMWTRIGWRDGGAHPVRTRAWIMPAKRDLTHVPRHTASAVASRDVCKSGNVAPKRGWQRSLGLYLTGTCEVPCEVPCKVPCEVPFEAHRRLGRPETKVD